MSLIHSARAASVSSGYEYYKEKRVLSYTLVEDNAYKGKVNGSNENVYNVFINVNKTRQCTCDCPFASGSRRICKHMIAMLFTIFPDEAKNYVYEQLCELRIIKKQIDEKRQKEDNKRINTEKYVASLGESQVRQMLINYILQSQQSDYEDDDEYNYFDAEYDYEYFLSELKSFQKDCKLKLSTVVEAFDRITEFNNVYININTNEIIELSDQYGDDDYYIEMSEMILENPKDYLFLPEKRDLKEYKMMELFIYTLNDKNMASLLYKAINRKHPYREFKNEVYRLNLKDMWFKFVDKQMLEKAKDYLFENRIDYINDIEEEN